MARFSATAVLLAAAAFLPWPAAVVALQLNITALSAANNASTLECWQIDTPFSISTQPGTAGSAQLELGNTSTISYSVLPAQFDAGAHNAPANHMRRAVGDMHPGGEHRMLVAVPIGSIQARKDSYLGSLNKNNSKALTFPHRWVVFLSGLAYITLPKDNTTSVYVTGGQFGLIFAADTSDVSGSGHNTSYPGTSETVALQIPTADGEIPAHSILHTGPCTAEDTMGLIGLTARSA